MKKNKLLSANHYPLTIYNSKGFSMIEVLMAVTIIAIGLLAMIGMQITTLNGNIKAQKMTIATVLAQDKIDELKDFLINNPVHPFLTVGGPLDPPIPPNIPTSTYTPANWFPPDPNGAGGGPPAGHFDDLNGDGNPDPINETGGMAGQAALLQQKGYVRMWNIVDNNPTIGTKTVAVIVGWDYDPNTLVPRHWVFLPTVMGN